mgnify:CR=1 FL=1
MNKYEVVLLFSPELGSQNLSNEFEKVKKFICFDTGKIVNEEDWGLRDLNYAIKKFQKAFYRYYQIELNSSDLEKIKKDLNQIENLLRYLFIKVNVHEELPSKLNYEKK